MPDPLEFEAAADGHPSLLPDHAPEARHRVRQHERTIPARPIPPDDPDSPRMFEVPTVTPTARKVPVKPHVRKNPRRTKETHQMTTVTAGGRASAMAAARARATDPETSHAAAASINVNHSQAEVLVTFQDRARDRAGLGDATPDWMTAGFTDEALVDVLEWKGSKTSPSRIRTARRELADLGLLDETGETRPTVRGRQARVFDLTERGLAFEVRT